MALATPVTHDDIFGTEAVRNARAVDDALRELGPVVKLARENITMIARYEHVSAGCQGLAGVLRRVAALARSRLGAARDPADRRSAASHRGPRRDRQRAVAEGARSRWRRRSARKPSARRRTVHQPAARDRCRRGDLPAVRLQGAARSARTARARSRTHGQRSATWCGRRWGRMNELFHEAMVGSGPVLDVGGGVLQPREPRSGRPRDGDVPRGRSRADHAGRGQAARAASCSRPPPIPRS